MSSQLRIDSSRANGAKSRGPVTPEGKLASAANSARSTGPSSPEGKARAARNALRHGILAESIVLDTESAERFSDVLAGLQQELQPETTIEDRFVETMAMAEWRRLRLMCLEKEQLTLETRRHELASVNNENESHLPPITYTAMAFRSLTDQSRVPELLNRYEGRCDRQYLRALAGFTEYRAARKKREKAKKSKKIKTRNEVNPDSRNSGA